MIDYTRTKTLRNARNRNLPSHPRLAKLSLWDSCRNGPVEQWRMRADRAEWY